MASLLLVSDISTRTALQRRYRRGELTRVRNGVYVDSHDPAEIEKVISTEWVAIANFLFADPVAVYRTAFELGPVNNRVYLMVARGKRRSVTVGTLQLSIEAGDVEHGVEPVGPAMRRSNVPRQLLENLTSVRTEKGFKKKLGRAWVEEQLLNEVAVRGETGINRLRDEAAALAPLLGMEKATATTQ